MHQLTGLHACVRAGHVSPGMHAFLTGTLTEHGLRRLAKVCAVCRLFQYLFHAAMAVTKLSADII